MPAQATEKEVPAQETKEDKYLKPVPKPDEVSAYPSKWLLRVPCAGVPECSAWRLAD